MRTITRFVIAVAVVLMSAQAASAQVPQGHIRVDNAQAFAITPCFRLVESGPWVFFGGIGGFSSFQWPDFMTIVEITRGVPLGSLDSALVEFTYTTTGSCPTADNVKGTLRTNIQLDRETNFTLQIGHRARSIELAAPGDKGR